MKAVCEMELLWNSDCEYKKRGFQKRKHTQKMKDQQNENMYLNMWFKLFKIAIWTSIRSAARILDSKVGASNLEAISGKEGLCN